MNRPLKVIKTDADHATATAELTRLMDLDPPAGTLDADRLELLAVLIETYEKVRFPISLPDPVDAVRFCMEQRGLGPRDLVPYLGSPSRVSEVLARRRPINLAMARRLHKGLGIPAEVLLCGGGRTLPPPVEVARFPFAEMHKRGWFSGFNGNLSEAKKQAEELLQAFFGRAFDLHAAPALHRQNVRSGSAQDPWALCAWKQRVLDLAEQQVIGQPFQRDNLSAPFLQTLVGLSALREGPRAAGELLQRQGVRLVIEPHLPGTHPEDGWRQFRQRRDWSVRAVTQAALGWNITPAIVAGRVRRETKNHRILSSLLGYRELRGQLLAG